MLVWQYGPTHLVLCNVKEFGLASKTHLCHLKKSRKKYLPGPGSEPGTCYLGLLSAKPRWIGCYMPRWYLTANQADFSTKGCWVMGSQSVTVVCQWHPERKKSDWPITRWWWGMKKDCIPIIKRGKNLPENLKSHTHYSYEFHIHVCNQ